MASTCIAAERSWEVRGEFERLKPGDPEVVVLRLTDGRRLELPLASLSEASRAAVREDAAESRGEVAGARPATPPLAGVPPVIAGVERDALRCRTAVEAVEVYRLFLADERLTAEQRSAAERRASAWSERATKHLVRLGDRWVSPDEARSAADAADKLVAHALELMRLGNAKLAEDDLRNADRIDPESGRGSFVAGLAYALVARNAEKSAEQFAKVVEREPDNAAALCNLAVAEILSRRSGSVPIHFRRAIEYAIEPAAVAENIAWAIRLAGASENNRALAKYRLPDNVVDELNALFLRVTQDLKIDPADDVAEPRYLGPDGLPCVAVTLAEVANAYEAATDRAPVVRIAMGFVVAPGHVVCPRQAVVGPDGTVLPEVVIESVTDRSTQMPATVIAAPEEGDLALVKSDALEARPLHMATSMPGDRSISAIDRAAPSWLGVGLAVIPGKIASLPAGLEVPGRFVHTAVIPRGLGGGPVIDSAGRVVGMVAVTPQTDASGNAAGVGVGVERIREFVVKHLADDAVVTDGDADRASESDPRDGTVLVIASTARPEMLESDGEGVQPPP